MASISVIFSPINRLEPLVKTSFFPSRENTTPPASVESEVICFGWLPSAFMIQICDDPPRFEMNAMRLESGAQRGRSFAEPSCVICCASPPEAVPVASEMVTADEEAA